MSHVHVATRAAKKWACPGAPYEDLVQVGLEAMWMASQRFDPDRGPFAALATTVVRRAIQRELARMEHSAFALPYRVWKAAFDASALPPWARTDYQRRMVALRQQPVALNAVTSTGDEIADFVASKSSGAPVGLTGMDLIVIADPPADELVALELARVWSPGERGYSTRLIAQALEVSERTVSRLIASGRRRLAEAANRTLRISEDRHITPTRNSLFEVLADLWLYEERHLQPGQEFIGPSGMSFVGFRAARNAEHARKRLIADERFEARLRYRRRNNRSKT